MPFYAPLRGPIVALLVNDLLEAVRVAQHAPKINSVKER